MKHVTLDFVVITYPPDHSWVPSPTTVDLVEVNIYSVAVYTNSVTTESNMELLFDNLCILIRV